MGPRKGPCSSTLESLPWLPQGSIPPKTWDLGLGQPPAEAGTQQSSGKRRTARGARENEGVLCPWVREAPNHRPMPQGT